MKQPTSCGYSIGDAVSALASIVVRISVPKTEAMPSWAASDGENCI